MATAPPPGAQVILPSIGTGTVLPHPLATPPLLSLNDAGLHRSCLPPLLLDDKKLLLPLLRSTRRTVMIATPPLPLDDAGLRRSCAAACGRAQQVLERPRRRRRETSAARHDHSSLQRVGRPLGREQADGGATCGGARSRQRTPGSRRGCRKGECGAAEKANAVLVSRAETAEKENAALKEHAKSNNKKPAPRQPRKRTGLMADSSSSSEEEDLSRHIHDSIARARHVMSRYIHDSIDRRPFSKFFVRQAALPPIPSARRAPVRRQWTKDESKASIPVLLSRSR